MISTAFDVRTAQQLSKLLSQTGYRGFLLAFGDGNRAYAEWGKHAPHLSDPLRTLVELFLLRRVVEQRHARSILGAELLGALLDASILAESPAGVKSRNLLLISFKSLVFFHECTQAPGIYFGNDSIALGVYQTPAFGGTTLDLCSGSSIQAMISAQHSARSFAIEINPRAAAIAEINLMMNALQDKVVLVNAALEDFARETNETFDLVTFNPPLLPVPEALEYPFVGDGGADGLDVTRRALDLYIPLLNPGGAIEFIGCGLGRDRNPLFAQELAERMGRLGASATLHLLCRYDMQRGDAFYDGLVETAAINSLISSNLADAVFDLHFEKLACNELYTFFLRGEREAGRTSGKDITIIDVTDGGNCWFR